MFADDRNHAIGLLVPEYGAECEEYISGCFKRTSSD